MPIDGLHVVFGAGGGLGSAVIAELAAQGARVRAINRKGQAEVPAGVEVVAGDGADPESAKQVCAGAAVVYHCANPPYNTWPQTIAPLMRGIIAGAESAGAPLVYGDNLYMYGDTSGLIHEELATDAQTRKGKIRADIAAELLAAHRAGRVRAVIGRAADFYGPFAYGSGELLFKAALAGKKAKALGDIDKPHTWTYTADAARGLVRLGAEESSWGQVWHLPSAPTITTRELARIVYEEAGHPEAFGVQTAGRVLVTLMGLFDPIMNELKEMMYQWDRPFILSHEKFAKAFGDDSTPHREAVKATLAWFRDHS